MKWLKQILFLAAIVLAFSSRAGAQNPVCSQFSFTVAKGLTATCTASAGINAGQILMISGSGVAPLTAGATSGAFAVALTQASSGQTLVVLISGQAQISSDGACAVGKYIIPSSSSAGNGHCTSLPGSAQWVGTALQTTSGSVGVFTQVSNLSSGQAGTGGLSSAGVTNDVQCKATSSSFESCGNVANAPQAVQYAAPTGNDRNSGLTMETAKATITTALCSLPNGNCRSTPQIAGTGTVYYVDGVNASPTPTTRGVWVAGSGDSQYRRLPVGWMKAYPYGGFSLICAAPATFLAHDHKPKCTVNGPTSGNLPLIWLSGTTQPTYLHGLVTSYGRAQTPKWGNIGVDSSGSTTSGGTQVVSVTIDSCASNFPSGANVAGRGPQLTVGNGYWLHLRDSSFAGNLAESLAISSTSRLSGVVTVTTSSTCPFVANDHISIFGVGDRTFDGTFTAATGCSGGSSFTVKQSGPTARSSGGTAASDRAFSIVLYGSQIEISHTHQEGGGGLKFYPESDGGLLFRDSYMEGGGATSLPPLWISTLLGGGGLAEASGIAMSDTPKLPAIINEGTQLFYHTGGGTNSSIQGPATIINEGNPLVRTTSLTSSLQSGFIGQNYFQAQMDIARRLGAPVAVQYKNLAFQSPSLWVNAASGISGSGYRTTTGKADPFRGTGAIEIDSTSGSVSVALYSSSSPLAVGETYAGGVWVRAPNGFGNSTATLTIALNALGGGSGDTCTNGGSVSAGPPYLGDGNFFWISVACTVWTAPTTPGLQMKLSGISTTQPLQVFNPWFIHIPASTLSTNEVNELVNSISDYSASCSAGQVCDNAGPVPHGTSCQMSAGTTCTATVTASASKCIATQQSTGAVIAGECSISGTTATVTAASSNSATWGIISF